MQPSALPRPLQLLALCPCWEALDGGTLVVACSGGADSTALARACHTLLADEQFRQRFSEPPELVLWHLDHGLRAGSEQDAAFVQQLGKQLGVRVIVERAELGKQLAAEGGNMEALARRERYRRLNELLEETRRGGHLAHPGAGQVPAPTNVGEPLMAPAGGINAALAKSIALTAHHLNDQAETILHHIVRGTHLLGLRGIAPDRNGRIFRPWLRLRRAEILAWLEHLRQSYVEDPSNAELSLTRNRIRHEVLPLLTQLNPKAVEHIAQVTLAARQAYELQYEANARRDVRVFDAGELSSWLPLLGWIGAALEVHYLRQGWYDAMQLSPYVSWRVHELLSAPDSADHEALTDWVFDERFADEPLNLKDLQLSCPLLNLLCISRSQAMPELPTARLALGEPLHIAGLEVRLQPASQQQWDLQRRRNKHVWETIRDWPQALEQMCSSPPEFPDWHCFLGAVEQPLTLRPWRVGERMALAGGGSKTIGDIFTDARIPPSLRPLWAVLADGRDEAVWIPGVADGAPMALGNTPPRYHVALRQVD